MKKLLLINLFVLSAFGLSFGQVYTYSGGDVTSFGAAGWPAACSAAPTFTQNGTDADIALDYPAGDASVCGYQSFVYSLPNAVDVTGEEIIYIVAKSTAPIKIRIDMQSADDPTAGLVRNTDSESNNVSTDLTTSFAVYTLNYSAFNQLYGASNNGPVDKTKIKSLVIFPGTASPNNNPCGYSTFPACTWDAFQGTITIQTIQIGGSAPSIITGITSKSINANISLYPNPTTGKVLVENNSSFSVTGVSVVNPSGVEVFNQKGDLSSVELGNLNKGIYFMKVETNGGSMMKKIVLQ